MKAAPIGQMRSELVHHHPGQMSREVDPDEPKNLKFLLRKCDSDDVLTATASDMFEI